MEGAKPSPITSKTGSKNFIEELQKRKFLDAEAVVLEMKGKDVTEEHFKEHGFRSPIIVRDTSDLGIKIPPVTDLNILLKYLVPDLKEIDVIDVEKQSTISMSVIEYFKYIMNPEKTRILNLISMEVSKTRLSEFIEPPKIVRDIDWVHSFWHKTKEGHKTYVPSATEKYCLISPSNSFTDFHIDFSGTSVWYHIVSGTKEFFFVKPTTVNSHLFWKWSSSYHKEAQFFGDQVDECFKLVINAGETLLLPTGWIHAVFTPVDSLVYGGNFLNSYNVEEQFAVYEMEVKEKVVEKYVYPHFRELNWFAAEGLCKEIDQILQTSAVLSVPYYLINAIRVTLPHLKSWSAKLSVQEKSFFNCDQLFKDMNRIMRLHEKAIAISNIEKRESTRVKRRPYSDDFILYDEFKIKKNAKGQLESSLEPGSSSVFYYPERLENEDSSEAWKVKTDTSKMLGVIIKRCPAANTSPQKSPRICISLSPNKTSSHVKTETSVTEIALPLVGLNKPVTGWSLIGTGSTADIVEKLPEESVLPSTLTIAENNEDPLSHSVHQDDEYIYPALDFSDDEEPPSHTSYPGEDKAWSPSSKSLSITPKSDRPQRQGKTKIAIEKGLEAAAAKPSSSGLILRKFIPPPRKTPNPRPKASQSDASSETKNGKSKPPNPKKGSTAKQRLGKILKIHRMRR